MSFKSVVRGLRDMKVRIGNISRSVAERKQRRNRTMSRIVPDVALSDTVEGQWASLPPKLLMDIIHRVEEREASWAARAAIVCCASVCKSWREITKQIVKTPEECGRLTFPISLKQTGPRESPIQCFVKRDRAKSVYRLYFGMTPSEDATDKLLLAAKRTRRATSIEFVISLVADNFSQASNTFVGKLRSNLLRTKFAIHDSQPPSYAAIQQHGQLSRRFHAKQVSAREPACNYIVTTVSYEAILDRVPRKMRCAMHSIPFSSIQEVGSAPTPTSLPRSFDEKSSPTPLSKAKDPAMDINSTVTAQEPLVLKSKTPWWHEKSQRWCLDFKGRVTVDAVENFQLLAAVDASHNIPVTKKDKVILQFGEIGEDIFTMDYCYPLSAFQAFAICLSTFGPFI